MTDREAITEIKKSYLPALLTAISESNCLRNQDTEMQITGPVIKNRKT